MVDRCPDSLYLIEADQRRRPLSSYRARFDSGQRNSSRSAGGAWLVSAQSAPGGTPKVPVWVLFSKVEIENIVR